MRQQEPVPPTSMEVDREEDVGVEVEVEVDPAPAAMEVEWVVGSGGRMIQPPPKAVGRSRQLKQACFGCLEVGHRFGDKTPEGVHLCPYADPARCSNSGCTSNPFKKCDLPQRAIGAPSLVREAPWVNPRPGTNPWAGIMGRGPTPASTAKRPPPVGATVGSPSKARPAVGSAALIRGGLSAGAPGTPPQPASGSGTTRATGTGAVSAPVTPEPVLLHVDINKMATDITLEDIPLVHVSDSSETWRARQLLHARLDVQEAILMLESIKKNHDLR